MSYTDPYGWKAEVLAWLLVGVLMLLLWYVSTWFMAQPLPIQEGVHKYV